MLELYGPMVRARALVAALGFKTYAAFYKARREEKLPVKVFDLEGRRGPFARTTDIADWLESMSE
ncbi:hypothetical protein D3H34_22505 [Acidovorax cavernicola]|uniref:Uncharacterized protein n=2 Tax=Acidovorax cavernicola TaxID=1675792 RepID=A0A9X8D1W5_9BURK|nr:hypothetical protein D3H34_22505 [Acidovorax cavernicola]